MMNMAHRVLSSYIHDWLGHHHGVHELGKFLSGSSHVREFGCLIVLIAYLAKRPDVSWAS